MAADAIVVEQVSHQYQSRSALNEVSFRLERGRFLALLGPNGSGKSTLFRLLSTLLPLQQGRIEIDGCQLPADQAAVRRRIGITFQTPALDVRLTVQENLNCHAAMFGLAGRRLSIRMQELLDEVGVAEHQHDLVSTLSGGIRRRVELAKGLLHDPPVILLDEPASGLDVRARHQFFQLLKQQQQRSGATIVMATHAMEEADACQQLLLLDRGRVVATGTPEQFKAELTGNRLAVRCREPENARQVLQQLLAQNPVQNQDELSLQGIEAERLPEIVRALGENLLSIQLSAPTLEDVFLARTGRSLSETGPSA